MALYQYFKRQKLQQYIETNKIQTREVFDVRSHVIPSETVASDSFKSPIDYVSPNQSCVQYGPSIKQPPPSIQKTSSSASSVSEPIKCNQPTGSDCQSGSDQLDFRIEVTNKLTHDNGPELEKIQDAKIVQTVNSEKETTGSCDTPSGDVTKDSDIPTNSSDTASVSKKRTVSGENRKTRYISDMTLRNRHLNSEKDSPKAIKPRKRNRRRQNSDLSTRVCYRCVFEGCDFEADDRSQGRYHLFRHFDYSPYCCKYCNARTKHSSDVLKHVKYVHKGKICLYLYDRDDDTEVLIENSLEAGKVVRQREMRYKCFYCQYKAIYPSEIKIHWSGKHPTKSFMTVRLQANPSSTIDKKKDGKCNNL